MHRTELQVEGFSFSFVYNANMFEIEGCSIKYQKLRLVKNVGLQVLHLLDKVRPKEIWKD